MWKKLCSKWFCNNLEKFQHKMTIEQGVHSLLQRPNSSLFSSSLSKLEVPLMNSQIVTTKSIILSLVGRIVTKMFSPTISHFSLTIVHNCNEKNGSEKSTLQIMMAKCLIRNLFSKSQLRFDNLDIFLISPINLSNPKP